MNIRTRLTAGGAGAVVLLATIAGVSTASVPPPVCGPAYPGEVPDALSTYRAMLERVAFTPSTEVIVRDGHGGTVGVPDSRRGQQSNVSEAHARLQLAEDRWARYQDCQDQAHRQLLRDSVAGLDDIERAVDDVDSQVARIRAETDELPALRSRLEALSTVLNEAHAAEAEARERAELNARLRRLLADATTETRADAHDAAVAETRAVLHQAITDRANALDAAVLAATETVADRADALAVAVAGARADILATVDARGDALDASVSASLADLLAELTSRTDRLGLVVADSIATTIAHADAIDASLSALAVQLTASTEQLSAQNADAIARLAALSDQLTDAQGLDLAAHAATQAEARSHADAIDAQLDLLEGKVDEVIGQNAALADSAAEQALHECAERIEYVTPASVGGKLDLAFTVAQQVIERSAAAFGPSGHHDKAVAAYEKAATARDEGDYRAAFSHLCKSYDQLAG